MEGFVDKNNDLLYRDLSQAMWKAGHSLIKSLFPEGNPAKVNLKRPPTAGSQFKASVATLMKNLQTKNPNYIRCFWDLSSHLRALQEAPRVTASVVVGLFCLVLFHFVFPDSKGHLRSDLLGFRKVQLGLEFRECACSRSSRRFAVGSDPCPWNLS